MVSAGNSALKQTAMGSLSMLRGNKYWTNRTGKTVGSFQIAQRKDLDWTMFSRNKVAKFLDAGTKAHKIRAKPGGTLRFYWNGKIHFRKLVNHPGTRPTSFIDKEQYRLESRVAPRLGELAAETAIGRAGLD